MIRKITKQYSQGYTIEYVTGDGNQKTYGPYYITKKQSSLLSYLLLYIWTLLSLNHLDEK